MRTSSLLLIAFLLGFGVLTDCHETSVTGALEERISRLEKRDETLTAIIEKQQHGIEDLQNKYVILEKRDEENRNLISTQRQELDRMKEIAKSQAGTIDEHDETIEATADEISDVFGVERKPLITGHIPHPIRNEKRFVMINAETVAFHATFAETKIIPNLSVGSTVPFTTVKLNMGNGYHPSTSLFIAPMGGIYIFSTSVMSAWQGLHSLHVGIMKNGVYLAGAYTTDDNQSAEQGSVTVATQLKVGDEVWVKHLVHENASVYGASLTSFMGCLVMAL